MNQYIKVLTTAPVIGVCYMKNIPSSEICSGGCGYPSLLQLNKNLPVECVQRCIVHSATDVAETNHIEGDGGHELQLR